jgi:hypothetical protein
VSLVSQQGSYTWLFHTHTGIQLRMIASLAAQMTTKLIYSMHPSSPALW